MPLVVTVQYGILYNFLQVMCRNCGVYYLAYEYNRDKKQRGDNGDSATTDVKDKGGTCAKYAYLIHST